MSLSLGPVQVADASLICFFTYMFRMTCAKRRLRFKFIYAGILYTILAVLKFKDTCNLT